MAKDREILDRLTALDARLARLEARLDELADAGKLRAELQAARERIDQLAQNGLHVVELLDQARAELRRREGGERA
jgi:hypothetical protein